MNYLIYGVLGLASGAIIAFIALGIVVGYRASGVVNFAQAAFGMFGVYAFIGLRNEGVLFQPIPGLGEGLRLGPEDGLPLIPSLLIALLVSALLGFLAHILVFRPMRGAPPLGQVVASVGLLLTLQAVVTLRFGSSPLYAPPVLPKTATFQIGSTFIPDDRVLLVAIALVVAAILWAIYRFTKFGLATRGAAEDEKAAILLGYSPVALAGVSWVTASVIGGLGAILAAQITGVTPSGLTLLVVPALAAALAGRLQSVWATVLVALLIGSAQSILTNLPADVPWVPAGAADVVPFIVIVIVMFAIGRSLPERGSVALGRLPEVPKPGKRLMPSFVVIAGLLVFVFIGSDLVRASIATSIVGVLICLSLVVLTGYVGQISLFQLTMSGVAAYLLAYLTTSLGIPFPIAPAIAAIGGAVIGLLAAVPALRVRGINLAIITFAFGFALDQVIFNNPALNNNFGGLPVVPPNLFGLDLGFISGAEIARPAFLILVLAIVGLCAWGVTNLRRSGTGRRMLAVRSDERAAAAAGISVPRTKMIAFGIAGILAGIAGTLMAYQGSSVSGDRFTVMASLSLLAVAYLGGITSVPGAVLGGVLAAGGVSTLILDWLVFDRIEDGHHIQALIMGVLLILMAITNPEGFAGAVSKGMSHLKHLRGNRGGRGDGSGQSRKPRGGLVEQVSPASAGEVHTS